MEKAKAYIKEQYKNAEKLPGTLKCAKPNFVPYEKYKYSKKYKRKLNTEEF